VFRHVFSYKADLGQIDYAVVHFNKGKGCKYTEYQLKLVDSSNIYVLLQFLDSMHQKAMKLFCQVSV
jgi:hypothetical protein